LIRRQLPAYSPLLPGELGKAALEASLHPDEARRSLRDDLERRFAAEEVLLTASGTDALTLALRFAATRLGDGIPVALPAYTCYDVLTAAVGANARVRFYDIDPVSLTPEPRSFAEAARSGVGAVVVGNLFGFPIDWPSIRSECERSGALLIEDAAQGLGSSWGEREAGSFGDLSVFSFGRGKGWSGGGGGALLVRRGLRWDDLPALASSRGAGVRSAVLSGAQWALGRPTLYGLAASVPGTGLGETRYKLPVPVRGIPAFCAAAARRHADAALALGPRRRENADRWNALVGVVAKKRGWSLCAPLAGGTSGALRYPLVASDRARADELVARAASVGAARSYPSALADLPAAHPFVTDRAEALDGARRLAAGLVTLPTHSLLVEQDFVTLERALAETS
jgi:hypothetical protein